MSRAVVTWPGSGRPLALRKVVRDMPSWRALLVMRWAKALSEPATCSAMAVATSLADLVTSARMASRTLMVWPGLRPSFDGAWAAAWAETVIRALSDVLWASSASNSRYSVIILVSDAG